MNEKALKLNRLTLKLNRETLRALSPERLRDVAGALIQRTNGGSADPDECGRTAFRTDCTCSQAYTLCYP